MQRKLFGNEYRTTMVCVDSYENTVMKGRIYNLAVNDGIAFESVMQFLLSLERLLDEMQFPQHYNATRAFHKAEHEPHPSGAGNERSGKLATFAVKVLFRQNASWQGSVVWLEEKREESFRSALELLLLIHSALSEAISESKAMA